MRFEPAVVAKWSPQEAVGIEAGHDEPGKLSRVGVVTSEGGHDGADDLPRLPHIIGVLGLVVNHRCALPVNRR